MEKQEYKRVSKRARMLLSGQEGYEVDFKKSLSGLESEDIVAFANSNEGGAILIGIEEVKASDGQQKGKIVGCLVGDEEKRKIISRAENCMPPIEVNIVVENTSGAPFFRVEIPSGPEKPYCTLKGTYKIRGDGVNKPLTPQRLLAMFMRSESQAFIERFQSATKELEKELSHLLENSITLEQILSRTFESATNTEGLADDAMALSDEAAAGVEQLLAKLHQIENYDLHDMQQKIDALLEHFGIEDPRARAARTWVEEQTERLYKEGANEEEILGHLTQQWEAGGIRAAWSEIRKWSNSKFADMEK
jgi:ATP-dependent DNA helicase RecG